MAFRKTEATLGKAGAIRYPDKQKAAKRRPF